MARIRGPVDEGGVYISIDEAALEHARHVAARQRVNRMIVFGGAGIAALYLWWAELAALAGGSGILVLYLATGIGALSVIGYFMHRIAQSAAGPFVQFLMRMAIVAGIIVVAAKMMGV